MTIDDYVLYRRPHTRKALTALRSTMAARPEAVLSRYEAMVADFPGWILYIVRSIEIDIPRNSIESLMGAEGFVVQEDCRNHKRRATLGDFRRKFSARTQNALNDELLDKIRYFGFDSLAV